MIEEESVDAHFIGVGVNEEIAMLTGSVNSWRKLGASAYNAYDEEAKEVPRT